MPTSRAPGVFEHPCPACGHPNRHRRLTAPRTLELCDRCGVRLSTGRLDSRGLIFYYGPWVGSVVLTAILGAAAIGVPVLLGAEFFLPEERVSALRPALAPAAVWGGAACGAVVGIRNWRRHRRGDEQGHPARQAP